MPQSYEPKDIGLLLARIVEQLVDDPQKACVELVESAPVCALRLRVAAEDQGKVIGKEGRTAHALRTVVLAMSRQHGHPCTLDIASPHGATPHPTIETGFGSGIRSSSTQPSG